MTREEAVQEYQCPGCVNGPYPVCFKEDSVGIGCSSHCAGTSIGTRRLFLGMPRGFCYVGPWRDMPLNIFDTIPKGWEYNKFNIPAWKHLDTNGNTLVRGLCPRINKPFLHVILGDQLSAINCIEITAIDIDGMD